MPVRGASVTPPNRVPIDKARQAAQRAVDATGLRHVAREIGLSPTGLQHFLKGGEPYAKSLQKLGDWYIRQAAAGHSAERDTVEAALTLLLLSLPDAERGAARDQVLAVLREAHERTGTPPPDWLEG